MPVMSRSSTPVARSLRRRLGRTDGEDHVITDPARLTDFESDALTTPRPALFPGGTIAGGHGVGLDKRDYVRLIFSDRDIEAQRRLKRTFAPDRRCSPETFPDEEGEPGGRAQASGVPPAS